MLSGQVQWWICRVSLFGIQLVRAAYRSVHCSLELLSEGTCRGQSVHTTLSKGCPFLQRKGIYGWWIPVGVLEFWICVRWDVMNSCWISCWILEESLFVYVLFQWKSVNFWFSEFVNNRTLVSSKNDKCRNSIPMKQLNYKH